MSVIESLQSQTKELEENAVLEEEMLNKGEKNDVKQEDKDEKSEMQVKDVCSEANEDVKESVENEVIAKPSPKANKKRKAAGVTNNAPNKKLHEETNVMMDDDANGSENQNIKSLNVNPGLTESEALKVAGAGAKTRSKV